MVVQKVAEVSRIVSYSILDNLGSPQQRLLCSEGRLVLPLDMCRSIVYLDAPLSASCCCLDLVVCPKKNVMQSD